MRIKALAVALFVNVVFLGCGGGGGGGDPTPGRSYGFTVTVSGLEARANVFNGINNLQIDGDGTFTFKERIAHGARYNVSVGSAEPWSPSAIVRCTAGAAAMGTATADVSVPITCTSIAVFSAADGDGDQELWATDGSRAWRVADINPGGSSDPHGMTTYGGWVYFSANDGVHGFEPWRTDGETAVLVRDLAPYAGYHSYPSEFVFFWGELYFSAYDPYGSHRRLWKTDGTRDGTVPVMEGDELVDPQHLRVIGEGLEQELYFAADGAEGVELWKTDGTERGTVRVADICPGTCSSNPSGFTALGRWTYFGAWDEAGAAIWRTDGTTTARVGASSIDGFPGPPLTKLGDELYYWADDGARLWKTDGTAEGTRLVTSPDAPEGFPSATRLGVLDETLFFQTIDETGLSVWKLAAGETAPVLVKSGLLEEPYTCYTTRLPFTPYRGEVYFKATDGTHGCELWKSDGTEGGTTLLADLHPEGHAAAWDLTIVNGRLLFGARATGALSEPGVRLWATDGSAAGTSVVSEAEFCGFSGGGVSGDC